MNRKSTYTKGQLPHWDIPGATFFLTMRLDGSLPISKISELKSPKPRKPVTFGQTLSAYNEKFQPLISDTANKPKWLGDPKVAKIWQDSLLHFDSKRYRLICSTIMPDHVHFIFDNLDRPLSTIMHSLKSYSANKANLVLGRRGKRFWQEESFDHIVRNNHSLKQKINYVLQNPVKARLVNHWRDWPWNYLNEEFSI